MWKKRGAIEVQFNWIFVLIVGALIIAFFVVVIKNQMETSDYEAHVTVQSKLNALMQNARSSPGTIFLTPLNQDLRTDSCDEGFYINDDRNLRIELETAFSPNYITSVRNKIVMWVLPWEMPFEVTNFMYVTSPEIKYILIGPAGGYADDISENPSFSSLPDELEKVFVEQVDDNLMIDIEDENNYKIRLVFFSDFFSDDTCRVEDITINFDGDSEISAVCFQPEEDALKFDRAGEIFFYDYDYENPGFDFDETSTYVGRSSLIGGIFAEDNEQFDCVMKNAYRRLEMIASLYERRTDALYFHYETGICRDSMIYADGGASIHSINDAIGFGDYSDVNFFAFDAPFSVSSINFYALTKSCPTIY
ncbi:hypothetical protein N9934_01085 [Desulfosarcina sp.]|nr:hypothetical protein [Desulfosarcina sp.]